MTTFSASYNLVSACSQLAEKIGFVSENFSNVDELYKAIESQNHTPVCNDYLDLRNTYQHWRKENAMDSTKLVEANSLHTECFPKNEDLPQGKSSFYSYCSEIVGSRSRSETKADQDKKNGKSSDDSQQEAPKAEPKHEAPKAEPKHEAPKYEPKHEAPKAETKHEAPKDEPKHEAPKAETKHEAPKAEEHHSRTSSDTDKAPVSAVNFAKIYQHAHSGNWHILSSDANTAEGNNSPLAVFFGTRHSAPSKQDVSKAPIHNMHFNLYDFTNQSSNAHIAEYSFDKFFKNLQSYFNQLQPSEQHSFIDNFVPDELFDLYKHSNEVAHCNKPLFDLCLDHPA